MKEGSVGSITCAVNIAYIDAVNVHKAFRAYHAWELDYARFRVWLAESTRKRLLANVPLYERTPGGDLPPQGFLSSCTSIKPLYMNIQ